MVFSRPNAISIQIVTAFFIVFTFQRMSVLGASKHNAWLRRPDHSRMVRQSVHYFGSRFLVGSFVTGSLRLYRDALHRGVRMYSTFYCV